MSPTQQALTLQESREPSTPIPLLLEGDGRSALNRGQCWTLHACGPPLPSRQSECLCPSLHPLGETCPPLQLLLLAFTLPHRVSGLRLASLLCCWRVQCLRQGEAGSTLCSGGLVTREIPPLLFLATGHYRGHFQAQWPSALAVLFPVPAQQMKAAHTAGAQFRAQLRPCPWVCAVDQALSACLSLCLHLSPGS